MIKITNKKVLYASFLLYFTANYIADTLPGGQLLVMLAVGVAFAAYVLIGFHINTHGYLIYIVCFTVFCTVSRFWAEDQLLAVTKVNSLIFIFIAMIPFSAYYTKRMDVDALLKTIMYGGYAVCIYFVFRFGLGGTMAMLQSNSRLSNELINANTVGMCVAYSVIINLYYIMYDHVRWKYILMLPAIVMMGLSGSRKAILITLLGLFGLLILKNYNKKKFGNSIFKIMIAILVGVVLLLVLSRLAIFSVVLERFGNLISLLRGNESRSTSDAWIRLAYNRLGMELFAEHPFLGIGIANANIYTQMYYSHNHYLHNNFIELLACGGITGFIIYYLPYVYLLFEFWKNRSKRNAEYDICLVLLVINLVMDYGVVSYYSKSTYVFLLLFWIEAMKMRFGRK